MSAEASERRQFRLRIYVTNTNFRIALEMSAFKELINHGTDECGSGIVSALHRLETLENALPRDSRSLDDVWIDRHKSFHIALIAACGSERMLAACSAMFDHSERYRNCMGAETGPRRAKRNLSVAG